MTHKDEKVPLDALKKVQKPLSDEKYSSDEINDLYLKRAMTEAWYSDTLAWLLDPRANHGFGKTFLDRFVKRIGKKRSGKVEDDDHEYARLATHLKFGKGGRGRGTTEFNFGPATTFREFYLSKDIGRGGLKGPKYCDVVVMDMESADRFMCVIENKLFSPNPPGQLSTYIDTVEERYSRTRVREFVFLTLDGHSPIDYDEYDQDVLKRWVNVSWVDDLYPILKELKEDHENVSRDVDQLINFLCWLEQLLNLNDLEEGDTYISPETITEFRQTVIAATGDLLLEELNRLLVKGEKNWTFVEEDPMKNFHVKLSHSRYPSRQIYVNMLPNSSLTIQVKKGSDAIFEKLLVPYGAPVDQLYNMIDLTARKISREKYFREESVDNYLADRRLLRETRKEKQNRYDDLFSFLADKRFHLQMLFSLADSTWKAAKTQQEEEQEAERAE